MSPRYDVFLSHATADKPEVEKLARKLLEVGIKPFFDKWELIPGEAWQEELEEALKNSETCVVFIGPKKLGPWHTEEMRTALSLRTGNKGFRVIPVLLPGSNKEDLPLFLQRPTWVDFRADLDDEEAFHRLLSGIRGTAPGPGGGSGGESIKPPHPHSYRSMAPVPERGFIHRRQYDLILEALCPKEGATPSSTSIGITTALRGAGGFGKTALAQMLCRDEKVQETYPDGILWATMGEDIDANGRLNRILDLIRWWTQKEPPSFTAAATAGAHLRDLLKESKALIVIDDVWSSADVTPFQGIGNGSALLITTRDSQTLPPDSEKIEVDAMASAEAVSLLRFELPVEEEQEFASLASRLGEWPLLLKMVNRQLRELVNDERRPVPMALKEINEALDSEGFAAFDREDQESRHAAASKTILVSVQRLAEKDREQYFQLAVFPEDVQIPASILEKLWGLGSFQTRKFCRRLHDLSLLLEFNSELETIRLHDVVRRVLIEQIGDGLIDLHRHLLDAFRPASGFWVDLPVKEGYLWRNLASHLLGAELKDDLRRLLTNLSFLQAKLNATGANALMADYEIFDEEERGLSLIRNALRLSAHVLARDRQQLASQLFGRLLDGQGEDLEQLLNSAKAQLRLRPRPGSLAPAGGPLLRTLVGHSDRVNTLSVVDGRRAVSGSGDGTLRVWDLETGETLRTLVGHSDRINTVSVVDGRRAISGSYDQTLRVWDLETGETLRTLKRPSDWVHVVSMVDSRRAVSGSNDGTLRVWDLETGETLRTLEGHSRGVYAVSVVDGRQAVSGSYDGTLRVWDLETGETLRTLEGHSGGVNAVSVVDSCRAISGSYDGTLRVWDLETGETLRTLEGHSGGVNAVSMVDGCRAVSGSDDGTLRVWDLEASETFRTLGEHSRGVRAVAVADGRRAVSGSDDRTLRVWDLETGEILRTLEGHSDLVRAVSVVDGRRAVSGSNDETLRVWDLETGETLRTLEGHSGRIYALSMVDGRRAVSGSDNGTLRVWDLETGEILRTLNGHPGGVYALSVVDGRRAISGSFDGMLLVRNLKTGEILRTLEGHEGWVHAVSVADSRRAVSGSDDRTLRVWDLETGEILKTLEGHSSGVSAVAVFDSRRAVYGSYDGTLQVCDLETGETLAIVTLDAPVWAVAVSLDGWIVVAGDAVGRVHFLDWVEPPGSADIDY